MKIHIEIDKKEHQGLMQLKREKGCSLNWLVEKAIKNYLQIRLDNRLTKKE